MDADFLLAYHHIHHHHAHHSHVRSTPRTYRSSSHTNDDNTMSTGTRMIMLNSARPHKTYTSKDSTNVSSNGFRTVHKQGEYAAFGIVGAIMLFVVGALIYNYFKGED